MAANATYALIELVVNAIDCNVYIDSVTQIGATTSYTIATTNTKWLNVNRTFTIGGEDYLVTDITPNTSFVITIDTQSVPTVTSFLLPLPAFVHGTLIAMNNERTEENTSVSAYKGMTPFIYFNEPSIDTKFPQEESAIDRESNCEIYFMHEADFENWTNEKHYYYCINAMENLIASFIQAAKNSQYVGEFENYDSESHVKWGVVTSNGHSKNLFNENLSGKKLSITLPFMKMGCDFNAYDAPSTGGAIDLVINFNGSEYFNQEITEDTTINIVYN